MIIHKGSKELNDISIYLYALLTLSTLMLINSFRQIFRLQTWEENRFIRKNIYYF